jgi:malonyl-CoA decarboxylase
MENEPLIFIEVALTNGVVGNIDRLLDENAPTVDPMSADSAMFYSISNTQSGLAGIGFGNFLIKSVVKELQKNHPKLTNFATLSPIPGFNHWLNKNISIVNEVLSKDEKDAFISVSQSVAIEDAFEAPLYENESVKTALEKPLMKLALHYLSKEKSGNNRAKDPVAHFHLSNGASIGKIHALANTSSRGMKESSGMMLNYLYMLDKIENNGVNYIENGTISTSQIKK